MKIAVIFHRFGPYHFARLESAAQRCDIIGVELAAETREYAWSKIERPASFERITLFPDGDSRSESSDEIQTRVNECLSARRPDAVAIPGWSDKGALAALDWCIRSRTPVVLMSESTEIDEPRTRWKEFIKSKIVTQCSAGFVGGKSHTEYLELLGMGHDRIFRGYDVVDNEYFAKRADEARARSSEFREGYGLPEHYFLVCARFIERKNLLQLIMSYGRYLNLAGARGEMWPGSGISDEERRATATPAVVPWHLVLLGDGSQREELVRLIATFSLQEYVHLPGFKQYEELPIFYGLADAFIHASISEPWGLVVNEAMASGLPVLVSIACGCEGDLVKEKVNGFSFNPVRFGKIAQLMLDLTTMSSQRRARMGQASREIIADWGPERFAQGLMKAAEKAVEVGPPRPTLSQRALLQMLMRR